MPLSTLIGNERAKTLLTKMLREGTTPSALLFHGPDGVGKRLFAQEFARRLMGSHKQTPPDLHLLSPSGASSTHPVETIRALLQEAFLPPYEAPVKVFIIESAHQMLPYSSNALLKTLEEPPQHTHFILLAPTPDALLPTLASRCRPVPFFLIPQEQIATFVQTSWKKSPQEARRIAFLCHGSLSKAALLKESSQFPWKEPLLELLSLHVPRDYAHALPLLAALEKSCEGAEFPQAECLLEEILFWYRDRHLLQEGLPSEHLYHADHFEQLKSAASLPLPPLEHLLEQASAARLALQRNVRLKTALSHFFLT